MKIFSHQSAVYTELLLRARTFFEGNWRNLPIKTRWHSLVVGPSGTGKSTLGTKLQQEIGASLLRVSVPGWMPSGAHNRAVAETIPTIIEHIHTHSKTVLFLDELDKLHWNENSWTSYIKGELFEILDGRLPNGSKSKAESTLETEEDGTLTGSQFSTLTDKLRSSTFVVGAGTFQDFYETQSCSGRIGFHHGHTHSPRMIGPSAEIIVKKLPRELLNRFNSTLLLLPALDPTHYQMIAQQAEKSLPTWIRSAFKVAAAERMRQAIATHSGCRFVEEALADALKCTRAPAPEPPPASEPDPCDW